MAKKITIYLNTRRLTLKSLIRRALKNLQRLLIIMSHIHTRVEAFEHDSIKRHQTTRDFVAEQFRASVGEFVHLIMQQRGMEHGLEVEFPPPDDCRWAWYVAKSVSERPAQIHHSPRWADKTFVANLRPVETVQAITNIGFRGWYAVKRPFEGSYAEGFVLASTVTLIPLPEEPKENEHVPTAN